MVKKNNNKSTKLIKFYNLINYNLIYNNSAINRYKKEIFEISEDKVKSLEKLKKSILNIKNCALKKSAKNIVAAIVSALEHGTQSNLSQLGTVLDTSSGYCRSTFLQDLETYMALCETYSFQKCKNLCFFV